MPPNARGRPVVVGFLRSPSGIGESARLALASLDRLAIPADAIDLSARFQRGELLPPVERPPPTDDAGPLLVHVNPPEIEAAFSHLGRRRVAGRAVIGYWAWELPDIPRQWLRAFGFVHEVWVCSRFVADAVRPHTDKPVRVVLPAMTAASQTADRAAFGLPEEALIVLAACDLRSSLARKNPQGAIAAFNRAFGTAGDRLLVVKVGGIAGNEAAYAKLCHAVQDMPNVRLMTETLSAGAMANLIASADIVLSLHRAEGFGLVPAQAMLAARPVVVTDWSGTRDFTSPETAALVPARLVPVQDPQGIYRGGGMEWADPDLDAAVDWMRRLAGDPDLRQRMGKLAAAYAGERLSLANWWQSTGPLFRQACADAPASGGGDGRR